MRVSRLTAVKCIDLSDNGIEDDDIELLILCFENLEDLSVSNTCVTDGVFAILKGFAHLKFLDVSCNDKVSRAACVDMQKHMNDGIIFNSHFEPNDLMNYTNDCILLEECDQAKEAADKWVEEAKKAKELAKQAAQAAKKASDKYNTLKKSS